jgi:hypothetical protein
MSEDTLLGVVEPEPPGAQSADPASPSPFEQARSEVVSALILTEQRLVDLRRQREAINAEIKTLVSEHDLLRRMSRVQIGSVKGTKNENARMV